MRLYHPDHQQRHRDRPRVSDDTKMGLVLLVVALVTFGAYAAFMLISFLVSLLSS